MGKDAVDDLTSKLLIQVSLCNHLAERRLSLPAQAHVMQALKYKEQQRVSENPSNFNI